jgi:hypothetical protein
MNAKPRLAPFASLWLSVAGRLAVAGWLAVAGCGKSEAVASGAVGPVAPPGAAAQPAAPRPSTGNSDCAHAVCADNFFVDVIAPNDCVTGSACRAALKLVATGDFHVNDEYPYRFRAEDTPGITFVGTDGLGKNVFSKAAGDWTKGDAKSGSMALTFLPLEKGSKTISGTFKVSVCSAENCLLEQRQVKATVLAK